MPFRKIPVNVPFWSNMEKESRDVVAEERRDVIKDAKGSTIRRPGLSDFGLTELPGPADGVYYWENKDLVYIVSAGNLYSMNDAGTITLIESGLFGSGSHVVWDESADLTLITTGAVRKLFATNGGEIVEYDGTTAQKLTDADAPSLSSHVLMFDTYLLSTELSDEKWDESIKFSKVADPTNFEGAFFSAENKPDPIIAMHSEWDEIALFGTKTLESFYNNGVDPFLPIPGATVKQGTLSPWTIKVIDNAWFMFNTKRRVVRIDGRQATRISLPIDDILSDAPDVSGATGEEISLGGMNLYLLDINDRTFVYDYALREWVSEWGFWNTSAADYEKFKARNFLNIEQWNITICTDKETGKVYKIDKDTFRDSGNEIRSTIITGNIDHGTGREKRSNELRLKLKRGDKVKVDPSDIEPQLTVRWKDNGSSTYSNTRIVNLGFEGDDEFYYSLFQLGTYRARQYEFACTDDTAFTIVEVEEDVELLR